MPEIFGAPPPQNGILLDPVTDQDHAVGPADAPITIVEYGDYECPDCFNFVPVAREIWQMLGDKLRFVFRHFPRNSIHPHASAAAEVAEAAGEQGKFWEMHEALFRHQKELGTIDYDHLALGLGLEIYQFDTARANERHLRRVAENYQSGVRNGIAGTPTLFINGQRYHGPLNARAIIAFSQSAK